MADNRLAVSLPGLALKNPLMPSSGAFYYGLDHLNDFDLNQLGALVLKTTTVTERGGNPQPWVITTQAGPLNSVGLANPGLKKVQKNFLPQLEKALPDLPVMISIAGETVSEYVTLATAFEKDTYLKALEINLSCPNVDRGGLEFGVDPATAAEVIAAVRAVTTKAIYAKLSPNVTDIRPIAQAVEAAGADGIVVINTVVGMSLDLQKRQVRLFRGIGGLSGSAIHPIAVRMVYEVASVVSIPIIGVGGIQTIDDALELLLAGASAVQVGVANAANPMLLAQLVAELPGALDRYGFESVATVTKALKPLPQTVSEWLPNEE
ncbi:dihydroorotate dehydrogenase [Weissella diestrammenae]|uniref:Dihydroorotate dehydrogenase n=1 Tax=Weissella diestrammenae TaxID=1162633 RepID=A0A7G9T422_9LACO|nr:dihydroorotate dehydrogenase [Weissella diestrammenae]MCM0583046.1 dihydroorotate dehydrogenase [Weissella diestrammenae]QNN74847.1 dihydroorotate dehydrogenase [Weissella diestrammenae]